MMQEQTDGFESNDDFRVQVKEISPYDIGKFHRSENLQTKNYELPSARQISKVKHSLVPDMLNGWIPRKGVISPVPIHFDNPVVDTIIETLLKEDFADKVVYLGPRYSNSYMLHAQLSHGYSFKYSQVEKEAHMLACFKGFYESLANIRKHPFVGTNPAISHQKLCFESNFESANLDCAIKTAEDNYDMYLRVDSNTKGHCLWYYFKVRANQPHTAVFNLCNLKKSLSLYNQGLMHPYFRRANSPWQQLASSCCQFKTLKYNFLKNHFSRPAISFYNLCFRYTFQQNDEVEFAYCIPYTYSMLLDMIELLRGRQGVHVNTIGQTLTGLDIPVLTFGRGHNCIVISARCHPGQSNGSWMAQQILRSLAELPPDSPFLQQQVIKVVPMLNPDGVVMGNYRSSLAGKDLNRCFSNEQTECLPEVAALKKMVNSLKQRYRLTMFLDLHGHSAKRNVFLYGVDGVCSLQSKIYAKLLAKQTDMFRYYSCSFKLAKDKRTTARACFMPYFTFSYTIQSSVSCYYSSGRNIAFDVDGWHKMGRHIVLALIQYFDIVKQKEQEKRGISRNSSQPKKNMKKMIRRPIKSKSPELQPKQPQAKKTIESATLQVKTQNSYHFIVKSIKLDEESRFEAAAQETDSEGQDLPKQQYDLLVRQIIEVRALFQKAYLRKGDFWRHNATHFPQRFQRKRSLQNQKMTIDGSQIISAKNLTEMEPMRIKKNRVKRSIIERKKRDKTQGDTIQKQSTNLIGVSRADSGIFFDRRRLTQGIYTPSITVNLRMLAPDNYVKPSETPNTRKAYVGKQYLSRLRLKSNHSVN